MRHALVFSEVISIHALREEGDPEWSRSRRMGQISIHALREEGDAVVNLLTHNREVISIHALREEGDTAGKFVKEV